MGGGASGAGGSNPALHHYGGGVTHRRPPTPEGVHRMGDHANNNTEYSGEYTS